MTHCVVFGATGYLGTRLVPQLLANGHTVRVLARNPARLDGVAWRGRVEVVRGDVADATTVRRALEGQHILYYLVHSLMRSDFVDFDERAARTVAECAGQAGLSRIVYVGGITPDGQQLSDHLASRAQVGRVLGTSGVPCVELRAAAIIGAGSASFEMLRYLTERLPLIVAPRWLRTCVQPIAVRDVLYYLVRAAGLPAEVNGPFDIGGPDRFTYTEMIRKYAVIAGLPRRPAVPVPLLTPRLSAPWVDLLTPIPRQLAGSLMESLENDVVCANHDIARYIPDPDGGLTHYEEAVEGALAHAREKDLCTRWSRADTNGAPSQPLPTDPQWAGGSLYEDVRQRRSRSDPDTLWRAIRTAVAARNWSALPLEWPLRGWLNGAFGMVRPSHRPLDGQNLHEGEALDWWRVEHIDAPRLVRLRADIPLPGRLWLELSASPHDDGGSRYRQRALFQPYGLAGQLFWSASAPYRDVVFGGIARDVTATARAGASRAAAPSHC
ncbi:SDR family oxidoreductase [Mycobacterium europaeum]|uniref:SDR family oxidoreductase n=1 Tax=Mycobacterium europaeum TaxID=761804 RepID=UPI000A16A2A4|nr:SDR family oxidoreductase [Mycobacterium europaeum]